MLRQTDEVSAALYCRYSKDDGKIEDSSSITTQKEMLTKYAREQGWRVHDIYCDDGYSGLNTNRPDFQRMIADAKEGRVNLIATKDLSRLSRNHIESDMYIEILFSNMGVRYVSILDGIDTKNQQGMDFAPFKSILNEMFSRDISKKVASAKRSRFMQGKFMGSTVPLGYKKDPADKNHLLINEEHAPLIRRIFQLCKDGNGIGKIRKILTEEKIPRPGVVTFENMATFHLYFDDENDPNCFKWSNNSVRMILRNPVYAGHLAGYKRPIPSMKSKKRLCALPEKWLVVRDTHESIIPPEDFELVQKLITSRRKTGKSGYDNIFSGIIKCADCGYAMSARQENRVKSDDPVRNIRYTCNNYATYGKKVSGCTIHSIEALDLQKEVLGDIRYHAELAVNGGDKMLERIVAQITKNTDSETLAFRKELKQSKSRLAEIDNLFVKLYEDKSAETITERNYRLVSGKYEDEQWKLGRRIDEIEKRLNEDEDAKKNAARFVDAIKNYKDLIQLDAEILNRLIDKITVGEAYLDEGEQLRQDVTIYYKFIGKFDV